MSLTIWLKAEGGRGGKASPDTRRGSMSKLVCSVTYAVEIAKSRSVLAGPATFRRPRRASRKPIRALRLRGGGDRSLQLLLEPLQPGDPLLDRRVGREDVRDRLLRLRGDDEEGVQALRGA